MLGGAGFESVVSARLCQDGKWPPAATLHTYDTQAGSWQTSYTSCQLVKLWNWLLVLKTYQFLRPVDFPILVFVPGTVIGVWDHFRLLDVPLCYCASETMWPCISHTLFSYQRFSSFAQKPPDRIEEFISGKLVHVRWKIQPGFYDSVFSSYLLFEFHLNGFHCHPFNTTVWLVWVFFFFLVTTNTFVVQSCSKHSPLSFSTVCSIINVFLY